MDARFVLGAFASAEDYPNVGAKRTMADDSFGSVVAREKSSVRGRSAY